MFRCIQVTQHLPNTIGPLCSLIMLALTWPLAEALAQDQSRAPNVVIIYTDDQGSLDLGSYGAQDIRTPELDALAREGIVFTNMYAPSAVCSASRAGLLTGMIPNRVGIPANVSSTRGEPGMSANVVTLAEHFAQAGYRTGHIGKWHLGYSHETMPNAQGFQYSWGYMTGVIDPYSHFFYWEGPPAHDLWRNGREIWEPGRNFLELTRIELAQFLETEDKRPFFLYWAPNLPHYPLQPSQSSLGLFQHLDEPRRTYAASLAEFDDLFGWFRRKLISAGVADNTLIIFQSDHGHSVEERATWGAGFAGNLRGHKASFFEAGLKVPAIFFDPTGASGEPGKRVAIASAMDWVPTLLDIIGLTGTRFEEFDGRSLVDVLADAEEPSPHEGLYWQLGKDPELSQWAVRVGDWKLIGNVFETKPPPGVSMLDDTDRDLFLVNLLTDPGERLNVVAQNSQKVEDLMALRQRFLMSLRDSAGDISND